MSRVVYLDGQFIPEAEAKLSIYDLSVMQAAAAFEMTRSFKGTHFKLREHIERLLQSCFLLGINPPMTSVEWYEERCSEVAARNDHGPGEEHRLLIVVSPGCAPMYRELEGVIPHPFVYIADFPLRYTVQEFSTYFLDGVHCVTSPIQQVPDACVPSAAKHRSRLHFHLAQQQAPAGTWPLMTRPYPYDPEDRYYSEAPGANICFVKQGQVYTLEENALGGISLQTVKELTNAISGLSLPVPSVGRLDIEELWLTGTPFCMLPVVSLDGQPVGDGKPGPVFMETMKKWNELVGLNIPQQIMNWDNPPHLQATALWTPDLQRSTLEPR